MGIIFGSDGNNVYKDGDKTRFYGNGAGETMFNSGNKSTGPGGSLYEDRTFNSYGGRGITRAGSNFYSGGMQYTRNGNYLYRSDGKSWYGVSSDQDVLGIIAHDN